MKLATKLLLTHLLVVGVVAVLLVALTLLITPTYLRVEQERFITADGELSVETNTTDNPAFSTDIRGAVLRALAVSTSVAVVVAAGLSGWLRRQIMTPIREVVAASQVIADGHYETRLPAHNADELGELAAHFNQMAAALADVEATRRQLMADVSHELSAPLASIKGYMEGLQDGVVSASPEVYALVHREAERLGRLVEDLQALSRAEAGEMTLGFVASSPAALIDGVYRRLLPQFQAKGVSLRVNAPASQDVPFIQADPDRLTQVLTNLIGNALQYTDSGGDVIVNLAYEAKSLHITVKDTGIGLAPQDLKRVFLRFYRVDQSRSRVGGGSGIGLTIACYLAEAHGGRLWAESAGLGQGSTFHLMLPLINISDEDALSSRRVRSSRRADRAVRRESEW